MSTFLLSQKEKGLFQKGNGGFRSLHLEDNYVSSVSTSAHLF